MKLFNLLLSFCLFFGIQNLQGQEKPVTKVYRERATTKDASGWYFAKSTEGHFSVLLPLTFADFTMIAKDTLQKEIRTHMVGTKSDDGFQFSVTELPKRKNIDLKAMIKNLNPTEVKEEQNASYSSISFKVQNSNSYLRGKYVATKTFIVMMIAECPVSGKNDLDKLYPRFFNSLKLY